MAAGANLGEKLFGMVKTIGPVFQSYAPGLGLLDLAVGVAGAVILYFVVQSKIKKARKFRRDMEYGSARWGTEADIKPFVDPKFENNVILTGTEFLTMNTRPKIPANARNLNACVIGSSGSGKTRFWLTPQLLQAHSSYVVVDPKGGTLSQCGYFLQKKKGYKVKVFNSIDFSKSMHYNPMAYIKTESDVLKFVNALIANTKGDGKEGDEFWTKAETLLYCALVAYIVFEGPEEERNMNTLVEMINSMEVREDDESFKNAVDYKLDVKKTGNLSKQIKSLIDLEIIARNSPINKIGDNKKSTFEINDNLLRFYFTFIYKNASALQVLGAEAFYDEYIAPALTDFISRRFEGICRDYFSHQVRSGKMKGVRNIGSYYYDDPAHRKNGEFDVALEFADGYEIYEAKYYAQPMTLDEIHREVQQVEAIKELTVKQIGFIAINGFAEREEPYLYLDGNDIFANE